MASWGGGRGGWELQAKSLEQILWAAESLLGLGALFPGGWLPGKREGQGLHVRGGQPGANDPTGQRVAQMWGVVNLRPLSHQAGGHGNLPGVRRLRCPPPFRPECQAAPEASPSISNLGGPP